MILQDFIDKACQSTLKNSPRQPEFIGYKEAFYRVNTVYDQKVVGAHQFSLDILKEYIQEIDLYNNSFAEDDPKRITSIRAWKAVSDYDKNNNCVIDLLLVPVRLDGDDAHAHSESAPKYSKDNSKMLMLGSLRPCPNLCGSPGKFFHTSDPAGDGFPEASKNPYRDCSFSTKKEKRNDMQIGINDFIE
jgi:hypothetical protein